MTDVAPCGCLAAKFDSCNSLLPSVHTLPVNVLRCVRLYIKRNIMITIQLLPSVPLSFLLGVLVQFGSPVLELLYILSLKPLLNWSFSFECAFSFCLQYNSICQSLIFLLFSQNLFLITGGPEQMARF